MIRAANHSSFPRVGESPLDQQLRYAIRRHGSSRVSADEVDEVVDEVIMLCVAEQSRAFIDVVTDGMVRWDGPLSGLVRHVDGLRATGLARWFDTNFHQPVVEVTGPLKGHTAGDDGAFLGRDYDVANSVAQKPVKVGLPGPVLMARSARDRHYGSVEALARAFAEVLAEEVAALYRRGARWFQLDEPLLCRHAQDLPLVAETSRRVFDAAGSDATTLLSTYFGSLTRSADGLSSLPGTHLGFDATGGRELDLLQHLPAGKGVYLGLFDAREMAQEDAADVAAWLEPYREDLLRRDVLVGPNAGLELLPRDAAFDKLLHARYLVERLTEAWSWES